MDKVNNANTSLILIPTSIFGEKKKFKLKSVDANKVKKIESSFKKCYFFYYENLGKKLHV